MSTYTTTLTDTFVLHSRPATSESCVVFDMDDTLCHYDKSLRLPRCHEFKPRDNELALALESQRSGVDVVIATARPCWTVQKTLRWLSRHGLDVAALYVKNRQNWTVAAHDLKTDMLLDIMRTYTVLSFHDDSMLTCLSARDLGVPANWVPGNEKYWLEKYNTMGWSLPERWKAMLEKTQEQ
jgi:hypothetical protein